MQDVILKIDAGRDDFFFKISKQSLRNSLQIQSRPGRVAWMIEKGKAELCQPTQMSDVDYELVLDGKNDEESWKNLEHELSLKDGP